jgi:hypothetical protein
MGDEDFVFYMSTGGVGRSGTFRAPGFGDTTRGRGRGGRFSGRAGRRGHGGQRGSGANGLAQTTADGRPLAVLGPAPSFMPLNLGHGILHGDGTPALLGGGRSHFTAPSTATGSDPSPARNSGRDDDPQAPVLVADAIFAAPNVEDGADDDDHDGGGGGGGGGAAGAGAGAADGGPVIRIVAMLPAPTVKGTGPQLFAQFRVASQNNRIRNCYYIWGAISAPISSVKYAESGKPWVRFGSSSKRYEVSIVNLPNSSTAWAELSKRCCWNLSLHAPYKTGGQIPLPLTPPPPYPSMPFAPPLPALLPSPISYLPFRNLPFRNPTI